MAGMLVVLVARLLPVMLVMVPISLACSMMVVSLPSAPILLPVLLLPVVLLIMVLILRVARPTAPCTTRTTPTITFTKACIEALLLLLPLSDWHRGPLLIQAHGA